jgi:hypothetical protein
MGQQGCQPRGCQPRYRRRGLGTQVVIGVLFLVGLAIGTFYVWQLYGHRIMNESDFVLSADGIEISPLPKWIRADITNDAMVSGGLHNLSMREPELTVRVAQAFAMQSWVKRVVRVSKSYPGRVQVEIEYRRPVAMVEVVHRRKPGLSPIDAEGVLLPSSDFLNETGTGPSPLARALPHIWARDTGPMGPLGTQWGDPRIHSAAQLAETLLPVWEQLGLHRIEAMGGTDGDATAPKSLFILRTTSGTSIVWGASPGNEDGKEAKTAVKIERLQEFIQKRGSLAAVGPEGLIDVRSTDGIRVERGTANDNDPAEPVKTRRVD